MTLLLIHTGRRTFQRIHCSGPLKIHCASGFFTVSEEQVGFARMVTDSAAFAYLADFFVLEAHQGKGLSKWLMQSILGHPKLQGLRRMALATNDADGLYEQFGFKALANPQIFMELHAPDVYAKV
ncbi:MAG: GNAT family N-acetyltransferase [Amphritea sp.]